MSSDRREAACSVEPFAGPIGQQRQVLEVLKGQRTDVLKGQRTDVLNGQRTDVAGVLPEAYLNCEQPLVS